MSGVSIGVTIVGLEKVMLRLDETSLRARDLTPAMKKGRQVMLASVDENFMRSGRPVAWRPLKESTLRRKLRLGGSPMPLIGAGTYTRSLKRQSGGGSLRRSITGEASAAKLVIGTSKVYGRIHQKGGQAGRNHAATIPARPYLVFQRQDLKYIERLIVAHVTGKRAF